MARKGGLSPSDVLFIMARTGGLSPSDVLSVRLYKFDRLLCLDKYCLLYIGFNSRFIEPVIMMLIYVIDTCRII